MTRLLLIGCCAVMACAHLTSRPAAAARREDVPPFADRVDDGARQIVFMRAYCDRLLEILDHADFPSGDLALPPDREQRLNHVFPVARFDNRSLAGVVATVSRAIGFPIVVNWNALASAGVTPQTRVSCDLSDATAEDILRRVVNFALGGNAGVALEVDKHQLLVTTAEDSAAHRVTRIYDLSPLLGQNDLTGSVEEIRRIITETVAPDMWADAGGTLGTIEVAGTRMRIVQTAENIAAIDNLLEQLDPDKTIVHFRATLERQQTQIAAINEETRKLVARCYSLGIRAPARIDQASHDVVAELHFNSVPASSCVEALQAACGQPIVIDGATLGQAGIDTDQPLTLNLHHATLERALQSLVNAWSQDSARVGYRIEATYITISTQPAIDQASVQTKVYDLHGIRVAGDTRQEQVDQLIRILTETVEPDSWRDSGGSIGVIRELNGQLIVTQSQRGQREARALLDQLRQPDGSPPTR